MKFSSMHFVALSWSAINISIVQALQENKCLNRRLKLFTCIWHPWLYFFHLWKIFIYNMKIMLINIHINTHQCLKYIYIVALWSVFFTIFCCSIPLSIWVFTTKDVITNGVASPLYITQHLRPQDHHAVQYVISAYGFVPNPMTTSFQTILPLTY